MSTKNYSTPTKKYRTVFSGLHSIYRLLNSSFELKGFLTRLTKLLCQIMNANSCSIVIVDPLKKFSILEISFSLGITKISERREKITNTIEKKILSSECGIFKKYLIGMPLISEDVLGLVIIKKIPKENSFNVFEQDLLKILTEQIVIAIKTLKLYEEQEKIVLGTIKAISSLLNTKIPHYTHSPLFLQLVSAVGKKLHLNEEQLKSLEYASILHDAGKVETPTSILIKPTRLTKGEFKIIKKHPQKGVEILRPLKFLKPAIPVILHHHERYDGKGYPSGLKKKKIPLGSRIMAVVDAFEAMIMGRPYKCKISFNKALKEIKSRSGTQFDPEVVKVFLEVTKKLKKHLKLKRKTFYNNK